MTLRTLHFRALVLSAPLLMAASPAQVPSLPRKQLGCAQPDERREAVELWCMKLIGTPDLAGASGEVTLSSVPSPFGVSVTRDGRPRLALVAAIRGLPAPQTLGEYSAFVAWASPLAMDSLIRLGVVRNGRVPLGEVSMEQFRLLVSAERSAGVTQRSGRWVLRGTSPGVRLLAHRDLTQPSAPGARRDEQGGADSSRMVRREMVDHSGHAAPSGEVAIAGDDWRMPTFPAWMRPMPAMHHMIPDVTPFAPGATLDPFSVALARPREILSLRSGDTLHLTATFVRRTIAGRTIVMYGYNGQHPGPLLQVQQGATIFVDFGNAIDQPSAVHWHGVRVENRSDGAVGVTQSAVRPGEHFLYRVRFRDAGIYWYHPHVREDIQQELGLSGNILVASASPAYWNRVNREEVLLIDDLLLDERGVVPFGREAPTHALAGRSGNVTLVNGEPRWSLTVHRGEVVRFHLTNAANARIFNLSFDSLPLKIVGSDLGRFERETWATSAVLAPAERYVVEARFDTPGDVPLVSRIQALDHMAGWFVPQVDTLGIVRVLDTPAGPDLRAGFLTVRANRDVTAEVRAIRRRAVRPIDHALTLDVRVGDLPARATAMLWAMPVAVDWNDGMPMLNWAMTARRTTWILRDAATGRENMDVRWRFRRGALVRLQLFNDPLAPHAMAHPIHIHGQRFLVLSRNGVLSDNLVWKDTAIIPVGQTVQLLVEMSNPGRWMIHCHIAEHLGAGMMMVFDVQ